jgi:hypothetical protein
VLFEALIMAMCRQMPFAAVARMVGESWHRVHAICCRYVDLALAEADLSGVSMLAIDETSSRRGQNYLMFAADAEERREGRSRERSPWAQHRATALKKWCSSLKAGTPRR